MSVYDNIRQAIEGRIRTGEYPPGSKLPSEPELIATYRASRGTVRRALDELEQQGIIARRSGDGTYVIRTPKVARIASFTKRLQNAGIQPSNRVINFRKVALAETQGRVAEAFVNESVVPDNLFFFYVERVRYANETPISIQKVYLLASDFSPNFLEKEDFNGSLYAIYKSYQRRVMWADEIVQARIGQPDELALLHMSALPFTEQIVYERNRISYDEFNRPLEVLISVDRADYVGGFKYRVVEDEPHFTPHKADSVE
jgi:GntR family transcriptional regulator